MRRHAVSSGICFGLVLLTKAEVALAVSAGLTPLLLTLLGRRRLLLGFAAGSLLPLLVAWLLLASGYVSICQRLYRPPSSRLASARGPF